MKNMEIMQVHFLGDQEKTVTVSQLSISAPLQCTELSTGAVDEFYRRRRIGIYGGILPEAIARGIRCPRFRRRALATAAGIEDR